MTDFIKKIRASVFVKLLLVIILCGFLINLLVGFFFNYHFRERGERPFRKSVANYFDYVIGDIGYPPAKNSALEVARKNGIQIRYEGKDGDWTTADDLPRFDELKPGLKQHRGRHVWHKGRFYFVRNVPLGVFIFTGDFREDMAGYGRNIVILIFFLTLVFVLIYLIIRKILRPVKLLGDGVHRVAGGDLSFRVPVVAGDELGELTASFNSMSGRIGEMMRAKEQLLLDVSHEIRTPLTRMKIALELIQDVGAKKSIGDDISEIGTMIEEILETERLKSDHGKLKLQDEDLISLIDRVLENYRDIEPGISFICPLKNFTMKIDPDRIRSVFKNVIENAIRHSTFGNRPISITCELDGNVFLVTVMDYGKGIPEKDLPYLFEPFYRADSSRSRETGGYGLGLHLCKKIMEAHGGSISIKSEEGKGTLVFLKFIVHGT